MHKDTIQSTSRLNRRAALGSAGVIAAGMSLSQPNHTLAHQDPASSLADHPLTGVWLAMATPPRPEDPQFPAPSHFAADGSVTLQFPVSQAGMEGVEFGTILMGTWEADGPRRGHFTAVQVHSDATGALTGSVTIDGYPEVSEDGQTFIDDGSKSTATIRDATGAILGQFPAVGARPVTAIRMGPGKPGFPDIAATPAATPAATGQTATINGLDL